MTLTSSVSCVHLSSAHGPWVRVPACDYQRCTMPLACCNSWIIFSSFHLMKRLEITSSLRVQYIHDCVPQIHCWNTLHPLSCIKRNNFSFTASMGYSCLLLISTYAIHTEHHLKWTFGPLNVLQSRRPRKTSVCNLLLDFHRDNTVCSWMCDEGK